MSYTREVIFYIHSLRLACDEIKEQKKHKSLKDVIGIAYEHHRQRLWEFFGFQLVPTTTTSSWKPDLIIHHNSMLCLIEEDKGHYVDSCFLGRALNNAAITLSMYLDKQETPPYFLLHSFTTYSKYNEKLDEFCNILRPDISKILRQRFIYKSICNLDRLPRRQWFQFEPYAYMKNMSIDKVKEDIYFFKMMTHL